MTEKFKAPSVSFPDHNFHLYVMLSIVFGLKWWKEEEEEEEKDEEDGGDEDKEEGDEQTETCTEVVKKRTSTTPAKTVAKTAQTSQRASVEFQQCWARF